MEDDHKEEICCPKFNIERWDKKNHHWENKKFIKDNIPEFFHIPLPSMISKKITRMSASIEKIGAVAPNKEDTLILFRDPSPFKREIYISVEKDVPNENNIQISGDFISRVFDGGYNDIPKFVKIIDKELVKSGKKAIDQYIHYAYCPGCAKKYGHNYMIIFARVYTEFLRVYKNHFFR